MTFAFVALAAAGCVPPPQAPRVVVADPPPDGSASCYSQARLPFYGAANAALVVDMQTAQTRDNGLAMQQLGGVLGAVPIRGVGGQVARGIGAAMISAGTLSANVQTDQQLIANVSGSFAGLVACRQGEARQIRLDVRARRIRAAEAREQLRGLRDLMITDAGVASRVNAVLAQRNRVYVLQAGQIETDVPNDPVARQQHAAEVSRARQTIQSSQHALTDQASMIDKAAQTITVSSIAPAVLPWEVHRTARVG